MSAVSSVSGNGQALYQFIQSLQGDAQTNATSTAAAAGTDPSQSSGQSTGQVQGAHHHHHHGGHGGDFSKIESAVTDALQSAQASGNTSDPNQVIQDAIAKVFKDNGIGGPSSTTTGQKANGADRDNDGDTHAAGQADGNDPAQQAFLQTLQSFGVDPQQFHADFLAAVKDAQGGQVDPSTVLKNLPPGS